MFPPSFRRGSLPLFGLIAALFFGPSNVFGQMVTAGFPLVGARSSFSEGIGINAGFRGSGFVSPFNNFGGGGPRFGGFNPNAGLSGGFGINNGGFGARFGFNFSQGSSRSFVGNAPVVTGFQGVPLTFQNNVQRPFVTRLIPNVGNGAAFQNLGAANTVRGRMLRGEFRMENGKVVPAGGSKPTAKSGHKRARVGDGRPLVDPAPPTRAERKAQAEAEQSERMLAIRKYLKKGREAENKGKANVAKIYYQMAVRRGEGDLKREALAALSRVAD